MLIRLVKMMSSAVRVLNKAITFIRILLKLKPKKKDTEKENKS